MADFALPGISNKYNTKEVRESLLEPEYKRLDILKKENIKINKEKISWSLVKDKLKKFSDDATILSRFDSPLKQMLGKSSNESILTATTKPSAEKGEYDIKVIQKANSDIFSSEAIPKNYKPPKGKYSFKIGEKDIQFDFQGNDLSEWIKIVNQKGKGFLKAETFRSNSQQNVLVLSSLKEGEKNPLVFKGTSEILAHDLKILTKASVNFKADLESIASTQQSPYNHLAFSNLEDGSKALVIEPASEASINLPSNFQITPESFIKVFISIKGSNNYDRESNSIRSPQESITYQDITIENENSEMVFENPIKTEDKQPIKIPVISSYFQGKTTEFDPIPESSEIKEIIIPLKDTQKSEEIILANNTSDKVIIIQSFSIENPHSREGYLPQKAISYAQDAKVNLDGVEVTRPSNTITDLIPRVDLNIKEASPDKVVLKIEPDYPLIRESIVHLIASYNELLAYLNILTTKDPNYHSEDPDSKSNIIEELTYLSEKEKKQAYELLGVYQFEMSLKSLKSSLQNIMTNAYDTEDERYRLLSQIGLSPNAKSGSETFRRGYFDINETKLKDSLDKNIKAVQQLFFNTIDERSNSEGIAQKINNFSLPYLKYNGIIDTRISQSESNLKKKDSDISSYKDKIEEKDKALQTKLRRLETSIERSESARKSMQNFFNPGRNNDN